MTSKWFCIAACRRVGWLTVLVFIAMTAPTGWGADSAAGKAPASTAWPQWGGPSRDFKVSAGTLAERWPEDGPRRLWSRPLGEGYSAIVADAEHLYKMYWRDGEEYVVALRADTGATVWECLSIPNIPSAAFQTASEGLDRPVGPNG